QFSMKSSIHRTLLVPPTSEPWRKFPGDENLMKLEGGEGGFPFGRGWAPEQGCRSTPWAQTIVAASAWMARTGTARRTEFKLHAWKVTRMARDLVAHNKPVFDQLHPAVYGTAVGLVAWFALA